MRIGIDVSFLHHSENLQLFIFYTQVNFKYKKIAIILVN